MNEYAEDTQYCKDCVNYEDCPNKILKNAIYRPGEGCRGFYHVSYERCGACRYWAGCNRECAYVPDHKECPDFTLRTDEDD